MRTTINRRLQRLEADVLRRRDELRRAYATVLGRPWRVGTGLYGGAAVACFIVWTRTVDSNHWFLGAVGMLLLSIWDGIHWMKLGKEA